MSVIKALRLLFEMLAAMHFLALLVFSLLCCDFGQEAQQCTQDGVCLDDANSGIDEDPRQYLELIRGVSIPSVEQRWGITFYKLSMKVADSMFVQIQTDGSDIKGSMVLQIDRRYRQMDELKNALSLTTFDNFFPPKHFLPDALRCVWSSLDSCNRERKDKLAKWLQAVIFHVCQYKDEFTTKQAQMIKSFLLDEKVDPDDPEEEEDRERNAAIQAAVNRKLAVADERATSLDEIVSDWWNGFEEKRGQCKVESNSGQMRDWVLSMELKDLEKACPDFGKSFGWWGNVGCPANLDHVVQAVAKEGACVEAQGGNGGSPSLICRDFVLKEATIAEEAAIKSLLYTLKYKKLAKSKLNTLLLPVCRFIKVNHVDSQTGSTKLHFFTISPKMSLGRIDNEYPSARRFDLKGNWGHEQRFTKWSSITLKDANFHHAFPRSFDIVGQHPLDNMSIAELVLEDSAILAELEHFRYSLYVNIVELSPAPKGDEELKELQETHKKLPLIWGTHDGKSYAAVVGITDIFTRFDKRSLKDRVEVSIFQMMIDSCTPWDPIPIQPDYYRTRFVKMVGYNVPGPGRHAEDQHDPLLKMSDMLKKCGACYTRSSKARLYTIMKGKKAVEYTYFSSEYQRDAYSYQSIARLSANSAGCEWSE